jgi:hypothetical protein
MRRVYSAICTRISAWRFLRAYGEMRRRKGGKGKMSGRQSGRNLLSSLLLCATCLEHVVFQ